MYIYAEFFILPLSYDHGAQFACAEDMRVKCSYELYNVSIYSYVGICIN